MASLTQDIGKQRGKRKLVEVSAITSEFGVAPAPYSNDANANKKKRTYNRSEAGKQVQYLRNDKRPSLKIIQLAWKEMNTVNMSCDFEKYIHQLKRVNAPIPNGDYRKEWAERDDIRVLTSHTIISFNGMPVACFLKGINTFLPPIHRYFRYFRLVLSLFPTRSVVISDSFCCSVILSFCRSVVLSFCRSVILSFCRSVVLSFCRSVVLSFCRSVVSFCHSVILSFYRSFLLSVPFLRRTALPTSYCPSYVVRRKYVGNSSIILFYLVCPSYIGNTCAFLRRK